MSRVASRTRANCSINVRFPDAVAARAAALNRRASFKRREWIGCALNTPWLKAFAKRGLFRSERLLANDRSPSRSRVPAAEELLVDLLMAGSAVGRRDRRIDYESIVVLALLALDDLVTFQAVDLPLSVGAHLVLVNNRVLQIPVALRAFA